MEASSDMITGTVNAQRDAVIRIEIRDAGDERFIFDAAIDTGFNRVLTAPSSVINALGLPLTATEPVELGNGGIVLFDVYEVQVMWNGEWRQVNAHATDTFPLVGMELLEGYELRIQVAEGGAVTIEAMP